MNNEKGYLIQGGKYHQGLESGEWKFFSDDGQLKFYGSYNEGKPIGIWYEIKNNKPKIYKKY